MTILKHEIPFDVKIEISSPQLLIIIKNFAKAKPLIMFYHNVKHNVPKETTPILNHMTPVLGHS